MPTPFAPIDAETITALNKGDEKALERIFRTHYDVLLERALERLSDEKAAAPRLVASVVRELWEERAGFHSTAEIEGFVNEEFRNRARAVRSRMAAVHRFEKTEGVSPAFVGGRDRIILVKDDGNRSDGRSTSSRWTRRTSALADFQPLTGGQFGVST